MESATIEAVLADWKTAAIAEDTRAALRLLECMTLRPREIDTGFVSRLHTEGLDNRRLLAAADVGFHYNFINRVADAFDFPVPEGRQKRRLAALLNVAGKRLKGTGSDVDRVRGEDGRLRPPAVEVGRRQLLTAPAFTTAARRAAVDAFVAGLWGHERPAADSIPGDLEPYLTKLALHAYRIVDGDVEALRVAGYVDEAIYELTMVASFGVALVGLEQVLGAVYEGG